MREIEFREINPKYGILQKVSKHILTGLLVGQTFTIKNGTQ